jgi:hypothetical protein
MTIRDTLVACGLELADQACRLAGMVPVEEHPMWPKWQNQPREHSFWRMSPDGSRVVTAGGSIYTFFLQAGRVALTVETREERGQQG